MHYGMDRAQSPEPLVQCQAAKAIPRVQEAFQELTCLISY